MNEANKKNGTQWEVSRRLVGASIGQKFYSIIKTGAMPVDLKRRGLGYTGDGVIGRIYVGFTPVTLPAPDPVYNLRDGIQAVRDFELYSIATAPADLGIKIGADLILEGTSSNQGKGKPLTPVGSGRILDPNTEYLLEIESLDAQNISDRLEMYNDWLDLLRGN